MAKQPKKAGGIALRPALWQRIERLADAQDKSKNEVMEAVLEMYLPAVPDFVNEREISPMNGKLEYAP